MVDCLFCKIIKGEIPAEIVYEDKETLALLDINPVNPGHVLVIPKQHFPDFLSASGETIRTVISVTQKVAKAICEALDYEGFNLGVNSGEIAGQVIPHLHLHIMPRKEGDGHELFRGKEATAGELMRVAEKIRAHLPK